MDIERLFSELTAYADDNRLLTQYRSDLEIDYRKMAAMPEWGHWVWVVSDTASFLYPIGFHASVKETIRYVLGFRCFDASTHVLMVEPRGSERLRIVSRTDALETVRVAPVYHLDNNAVVDPATGNCVGTLELMGPTYNRGAPTVGIRVGVVAGGLSYSTLFELARQEAFARHSCWCDAIDLTDQMRSA